jgi:hypothetical protein
LILAALLLPLLGPGGCRCDDECDCTRPDADPPAAPRGLYSVTGDGRVTLGWLSNTESDVKGYYLWWSDRYSGSPYHLVAEVPACSDGCYWMEFEDAGLANGQTFYYAVSAYDQSGNESDLSREEVWDTPRPEGRGTVLNVNAPGGAERGGFDFSRGVTVPSDTPACDFFYVYSDAAGGFLVAGSETGPGPESTEIQDMGWTATFDEISFAPDDAGWSPTGTAEPVLGHTYVLLTRDFNYAKIRVTGLTPERVSFDWAYQQEPWNVQLSVPAAR